jgi:hypothetical protein
LFLGLVKAAAERIKAQGEGRLTLLSNAKTPVAPYSPFEK